MFIKLLNKVRINNIDGGIEKLLKVRLIHEFH